MTYGQYLSGLDLRWFMPHELTRYAGAVYAGVRNEAPPEEHWANVRLPLWVLDHLRERLGPVIITSSHRGADYNRAVNGKPRSYHLINNALDFQCLAAPPRECFDLLMRWRDAGLFVGGLGLYATFVHLDCGLRGRNADW